MKEIQVAQLQEHAKSQAESELQSCKGHQKNNQAWCGKVVEEGCFLNPDL